MISRPANAAEAVAQGAQLLDEKDPGWWRKINLETLVLSNSEACICGQLGRTREQSYHSYIAHVLGLTEGYLDGDRETALAACCGFDALPNRITPMRWTWITTFPQLHCEWEEVINARLAADTLAPVEEKELVTA